MQRLTGHDPEVLLEELLVVYRPDTLSLLTSLTESAQAPGQSPISFLATLVSLHHKYRCATPDTVTGVHALIPLFLPFVRNHLQSFFIDHTRGAVTANTPVILALFKEWIQHIDQLVPNDQTLLLGQGGAKSSGSNVAPSPHHYNTRSKDGNARESNAPTSAGQRGSPPLQNRQGSGSAGSSAPRSQSYQGPRIRNNNPYNRTQPSGPPGVNFVTVQTRSPTSHAWSQQNTVSAVGQRPQRRPPNPEPHLPGVDASPPRTSGGESAPPVVTTAPASTPPADASLEGVQATIDGIVGAFRANAPPTQRVVQSRTGHPLPAARNLTVSRVANMTNGLSLADLHELYPNPHYSGVMRELGNLLGHTSDTYPSFDSSPPAAVRGGAIFASPQPSRNVSAVQTQTTTPPLRVTNVCSATPETSSVKSYRDATGGRKTSYMVSMPAVKMGLSISHPFSEDLQRVVHFDTGANMSVVSQSAYDRDFQALLEYGDMIPLHYHTISVANGTTAVVTHMVKGARIIIGRAYYEVDLFIVPASTHEYVLSMAFMVEYRTALHTTNVVLTIPVMDGTALAPPDGKPGHEHLQTVQLKYKGWRHPIA
jgi:hypothetical protein